MSAHRFIDIICIIVIVFGIIATVLFMNGEKIGLEIMVDADAEGYAGSTFVTENDLVYSDSDDDATIINVNGTNAVINGNGAYMYEGDLVIARAGKYIVTGNITDGAIVVDADKNAKVNIILANFCGYCNNSAALRIDKADKVFITLAKGTNNVLSTGEEAGKKAKDKGFDGAITSKDDLTINGEGSLVIDGVYKHGVEVKDSLVVAGGNITINAKKDAIHVKDDVSITNANIAINAGDDGITAGKIVNIENCNITVKDCKEGIEAAVINVYSGDINIHSRDDGFNARVSGKDLSVESCIYVEGGNIRIVNETAADADGFDSNGDIVINGGFIFISLSNQGTNNAIDYGIECGGICTVSGGTVVACGSYAMAEGFDKSSSQPSVLYTYSQGADANSVVTVCDSHNNVLFSDTVPNSFSSLIFSHPDLKLGEKYSIIIDEVQTEITLNDMAASYGDVRSEGFFGPMNFDGMKPYDGKAPRDVKKPDDGNPGYHQYDKERPEGVPKDVPPVDEMRMNKNHDGSYPSIPDDIRDVREKYSADAVSENAADELSDANDMAAGADNMTDIRELPIEVIYMLAASLAAIVVAIIFAAAFRRR